MRSAALIRSLTRSMSQNDLFLPHSAVCPFSIVSACYTIRSVPSFVHIIYLHSFLFYHCLPISATCCPPPVDFFPFFLLSSFMIYHFTNPQAPNKPPVKFEPPSEITSSLHLMNLRMASLLPNTKDEPPSFVIFSVLF